MNDKKTIQLLIPDSILPYPSPPPKPEPHTIHADFQQIQQNFQIQQIPKIQQNRLQVDPFMHTVGRGKKSRSAEEVPGPLSSDCFQPEGSGGGAREPAAGAGPDPVAESPIAGEGRWGPHGAPGRGCEGRAKAAGWGTIGCT